MEIVWGLCHASRVDTVSEPRTPQPDNSSMPRSEQPRTSPAGRVNPSRAPARKTGRPAAIVPLARQTVASMTLDAIRDGILHGIYTEGEPLRQDALAAELGVSRIPIREALRQLEAEGLVTFSPHRGAIVSILSLAEIEEVFDIRANLEPDLLRRAIPRLTTYQLDQADEILDRKALAERAHEGLARLPDIYRDAFVLRDLEELPTDEVGELLGIDSAAVRQRVHRARLMLRGYLSNLVRVTS